MALSAVPHPSVLAVVTTDDLLRELIARQQALEAKVDLLLSRLAPGPRDAGDAALVGVITASSRGLTFTASALWRHRAVDPTLADALATCDLENAKQLGKLLRRLEGRTVAGVRIVSVGLHREGRVWKAEVQE